MAISFGSDGETFDFAKRFILDGYTTKSLRCRGCAHDASCEGLHVKQVRAHGYAGMQPIPSDTEEPRSHAP